jgi:hypothetical protein
MRLGFAASALALTLLAAACGDGGAGGDSGENEVIAPTPFPQSLISSTMLLPEDVGPGYELTLLSNPPGPSGRSVNAQFQNESMYIQSTVIHYPDRDERDRMFIRNREVSAAFGHREENYAVEGLDLAFLQRIFNPPGQATWATLGDNWIIYVQTSALGEPPDPRATDPAYLQQLASIVAERLNKLVSEPDLVTPLPDVVQATFPPGTGTPQPAP